MLSSPEKPPTSWADPKFPTQCYFLTLHCQHLALMPACRHFTRRIRGMRELARMVEEMQGQEEQWKGTPNERRNRQLLDKWKSQIKVKSVFLLIGQQFATANFVFFSTISSYTLLVFCDWGWCCSQGSCNTLTDPKLQCNLFDLFYDYFRNLIKPRCAAMQAS